MADEISGTPEASVDDQLEALLKPKPAAPAAAPKEGTTPDLGQKPDLAASPNPAETPDPLLAALDAIEEDKPEDPPAAPKLSTEQEQVLRAVPDVQTANRLYQVVENYNNFAGAFESGKYDDVQRMFESWNSAAFDGFLEHIYAKKVESGEWVDRFIAEKEGRGTEHKGVKELQRQIADLKAKVDQQGKPDLEAEANRRQTEAFANYNTHVKKLFDDLNFAEKDRKYVKATLDAAVAADPKLVAALKSGNPKAVNGLFKTTLREYATRDKEVSTATADKLEAQGKKKLPLGSAAGDTSGNEIPEDINLVKKEDRESWVDRSLAALFSKKK